MKSRDDFKTDGEYREYLRKYFAALAMQGLLSNGGQVNHQVVAAFAIRTADALLLELEKTETP